MSSSTTINQFMHVLGFPLGSIASLIQILFLVLNEILWLLVLARAQAQELSFGNLAQPPLGLSVCGPK